MVFSFPLQVGFGSLRLPVPPSGNAWSAFSRSMFRVGDLFMSVGLPEWGRQTEAWDGLMDWTLSGMGS